MLLRYKTLSSVWIVLLMFAVNNAFSISVNPKSKQFLRKTTKNYSKSRSKNYSNPGSGKSSHQGSGTASASGSGSYSSSTEDTILYTLPEPKESQTATMVDVIDGDTIRVILDDSPCTVSLFGIDTPEKTQPHGEKVKQVLGKLLKRKKVNLKIYDKGNKARCLAVVSAGGKNINELLVKGGHAWVNRRYCYESFCSDWESYQEKAKSQKKGLWGYPDPKAPWVWRALPAEKRRSWERGYSPVANGLRSRYGKYTTIMGDLD